MDNNILLTERIIDIFNSLDKNMYNIVRNSLRKLSFLDIYSSPDIKNIENNMFVYRASDDIRIAFNYSKNQIIVLDITNKSGTNFSNANMEKANLENSNFSFSNFSSTNLRYANLSHAIFEQANFEKANLSSSNLSGSRFTNANLDGADLSEANLKSANFEGAKNLDKIKSFKNAILIDTVGLSPQIIKRALAEGAKIKDK